MLIGIVFGTRPEIIKLASVIKELELRKTPFFLVHTNQHFSPEMDEVFIKDLGLPRPKYNLGISRETRSGSMVGKMLIEIENILVDEKPDWVIAQGDTNSVLAAALSASKLQIKFGHIEAGLRSYDRTMPEELNRIVADHLSEILFCPTEEQKRILLREGIDLEKIHVVGNTIVDAVKHNIGLAKSPDLSIFKNNQKYLLLTMHRPSNVDFPDTLMNIVQTLEKLSIEMTVPIIFPIHPRTGNTLKKFSIHLNKRMIRTIDPVGYFEMLWLIKNASLVITDSGGVQEEACILMTPCITIRENTERPETVVAGANMVVGTKQEKIISSARIMAAKVRDWDNPYGDGKSGEQIVSILCKK